MGAVDLSVVVVMAVDGTSTGERASSMATGTPDTSLAGPLDLDHRRTRSTCSLIDAVPESKEPRVVSRVGMFSVRFGDGLRMRDQDEG